MRKSLRCPKCSSRKILAVDAIEDKSEGRSKEPLSISSKSPWAQGGKYKNHVGTFEACLCGECGYTEWYVKDIANLPIDGELVREISAPDADQPFR